MKLIFPVKYEQHRRRNVVLCFIAALRLFIACNCNTDPVVNPSAFEKPYVFGILSSAAKQHEIFLVFINK